MLHYFHMQRSHIIGLLVLIFILALAGTITYYFYKTPNDDAHSDAKRTLSQAEEKFTNLNGEKVAFKEYEGKVRVVNVWASWSPFSAQELPLLEEVAGAYKDKGVVVIAVNRNEPKELAQRYLETLGTFSDLVVVIDPEDRFYEDVEGFAMPETVFYDARGNISNHKRGNMTKEEMIRLIEEALQKGQ